MSKSIFISHSTRDSDFVIGLRRALEAKGFYNLVDSSELRGKDESTQRIRTAIEQAGTFIVIISFDAFNSAWVAEETRYASLVKERRRDDYSVIPLLRDGVELGALKWIFSKIPVAIRISGDAEGIRKALPQIMGALSKRLPNAPEPIGTVKQEPIDELILELRSPFIEERSGTRRIVATAELTYIPAAPDMPSVGCREPFLLTAPICPFEINELKWYLEQYFLWPAGPHKTRALNVENKIPGWGLELYRQAAPDNICADVMDAWGSIDSKTERRLTVFADSQLVKGSSTEKQKEANEASVFLIGLPWELMHDGEHYLFQGAKSVMARRQLPLRMPRDIMLADSPVRVLLASPRQEDENSEYIAEQQINSVPLTGIPGIPSGAELTVLNPVTFPGLLNEIELAQSVKTPYHVVHFDGHRIFKKDTGCAGQHAEKYRPHDIHADNLAGIIQDYSIHVFFSRSLAIR
ncbi:MAG: TIR domain-containing protein [Desulfobacteraceae bacterium]|nr:TIR domain-containing protein [Desulfobacteraceae bacterium]